MSIIRVNKKFSKILTNHQKKRIIELGFLMVIGGLLETLSVSLMVPFITAVMNPDNVMANKYVRILCRHFGIHSSRTFLIAMAIGLAVIYILKNAYLLFEYNIQYRFVYGNMHRMQSRLLQDYLNKPYEFFLRTNSSEIYRTINSDTYNTFLLQHTLLSVFTEVIVSIMLVMTVFIIAPFISACIAVVLFVLVLVINFFVKPVLRNVGIDMMETQAKMQKWLFQAIQGIKDLKVTQSEGFFVKNFETFGSGYVRDIRKSQVLGLTPKYIIEAASMGTMFIIVAGMIYFGSELESMVPMLSAIAMGAIRLLPSINRISSALGAIAINEPMLDSLISTLNDDDIGNVSRDSKKSVHKSQISKRREQSSAIIFNKSIDFRNITFCYSGAEKYIFEDASLHVLKGESIGLVGESGAGKSTAVDIMLGLLYPSRGEIMVDGKNIYDDLGSWYSQIGYIPQSIFLMDDSIRENVSFGKEDITDEQIWETLKKASIDEFVRTLPDELETQIGERGTRLSGGQRQRIGIARALCRNPQVLIFDEATSALDNETEASIMESIHNLHGQKTMIIIAHRLSTIENCDHIYRVKDGKLERQR